VVNTLAASLAQHRQFGFAESAVEIGGSEIFFNRSRLGSVSWLAAILLSIRALWT
jgi:hypothetical protein